MATEFFGGDSYFVVFGSGGGLPGGSPKRKKPEFKWIKLRFNLFWIGYFNFNSNDEEYINKIKEWCENNCKGRYKIEHETMDVLSSFEKYIKVYLSKESDAMAFKLRWL